MFDPSLSVQGDAPYQEMIYFPLKISSLFTVLISAIATGIVVLLSLIFRLYKKPFSAMVLAINIAHVLFYYSKLSVLVFPPQSDLHCKILSIINVFGLESAAIWGALFAHAFYIIIKHQGTSEITRMMKYYVPIAVLVPLINGVVSFLSDYLVFSDKEATCVHRIYFGHIDVKQIFFGSIPVWSACVASLILYKLAINKIAQLQNAEAGTELYILLIYPGIFLLCWGPILIVQATVQFGATPSETLIKVLIALTNLQGFFDALVYGRSIREALNESITRCLGKNIKKEGHTFIEPSVISERNLRELSAGNYSLLSARNDLVISSSNC